MINELITRSGYKNSRRGWKLIGSVINVNQHCSDVNTLVGSVPIGMVSAVEMRIGRLALAWVKEENESEDDVETCGAW